MWQLYYFLYTNTASQVVGSRSSSPILSVASINIFLTINICVAFINPEPRCSFFFGIKGGKIGGKWYQDNQSTTQPWARCPNNLFLNLPTLFSMGQEDLGQVQLKKSLLLWPSGMFCSYQILTSYFCLKSAPPPTAPEVLTWAKYAGIFCNSFIIKIVPNKL